MKRLLRRIYLYGFLFEILIIAIFFFGYNYSQKMILQNAENNIRQQMEYVRFRTASNFDQDVQLIHSARNFIRAGADDEQLLLFLTDELNQSESFMSLYYGTPDNQMINGSGWIPPDDFDLRTRPWYTKAIHENTVITTSIYLNASKDHWIVTIAEPVCNTDGEMVGVVAGDRSMEDVLLFLRSQDISENSYTFFVDSEASIILNTDPDQAVENISESNQIIGDLQDIIGHDAQGLIYAEIGGVEGYVGWNAVEGADWRIGAFVPIYDLTYPRREINRIMLIVTSISLGLFVIAYLVQRRGVAQPLERLNTEILALSPDNTDTRLTTSENDTFNDIRGAINTILERMHIYFQTMRENQEELQETNQILTENKTALERNESRLRALLESFPDSVLILNAEGEVLENLSSLSSMPEADDHQQTPQALHPIMDRTEINKAIAYAVKSHETHVSNYAVEDEHGSSYYEARVVPIAADEFLVINRNVTDQQSHLNRIEYLSYRDQLTGLYNRHYYEKIQPSLNDAATLPLSLIMLDVNGLKLTNDAFGHQAGDQLLIYVAEIIRSECDGDMTVARIGGDEFVIVMSHTTYDDASAMVQKLYQRVEGKTLSGILLSVSIGLATRTGNEQSIQDLFRDAEDSMYRRKITESQSMHNRSIQMILNTLNNKSAREKQHSDRVSKICLQIGKAMDLPHQTQNTLVAAGLMHDIGKIAISDNILDKESRLSDEEYKMIQKHPEIGYQILKTSSAYSSLAEYILCHHEHWDGTGYPRGIAGEEIPLISRILCVADAFDAMTSDRPYRMAMSVMSALDELKRHSGSQFDPAIVRIIRQLVSDIDIKL